MASMDEDAVTQWLGGLNAGDQRAAERLWQAYFERLTRVARRKLDPGGVRHSDEEDAALSAMHSFCRGAREGRYARLADRDQLWRLLVTITLHKVARQQRDARRQKRGGGRTRGESAFIGPGEPPETRGIEQVLASEPTAETAALLAENFDRLMARLDEDSLRRVAQLKLEGHSNEEIAEQLACTVRSVERKLQRIRSRWKDDP
jgi:DNA-directed RNA polymerase specialized sigma24 family protein